MAFYDVYSHPALVRYKTSVCTKATLFACVVLSLTYVSPLLVAYRSHGTATRSFHNLAPTRRACLSNAVFRVLGPKEQLRGAAGREVPVPDSAGGGHQYPGGPRRLEHLPPPQQHAGGQPPDPVCLRENTRAPHVVWVYRTVAT